MRRVAVVVLERGRRQRGEHRGGSIKTNRGKEQIDNLMNREAKRRAASCLHTHIYPIAGRGDGEQHDDENIKALKRSKIAQIKKQTQRRMIK